MPSSVIENGNTDALLKLLDGEAVREARIALASTEAQQCLMAMTELLTQEGVISEIGDDGYVLSNPGLKANCLWILFKVTVYMEAVVILCIASEVVSPVPCILAIMQMLDAIQEFEEHCRG